MFLFVYLSLVLVYSEISCQYGTYIDSGVCQPCNWLCRTCENNIKCLSCEYGNFLDNITSECYSCPQYCSECSSYNNCTSCIYGNPIDGICSVCGTFCDNCTINGCIECIDGYYLDNYNCRACPSGCYLCDQNGQCTDCSVFYLLMDNVCNYIGPCENIDNNICAACNVGYYLASGICIPCTSPCADCSSALVCLKCDFGYYLELNNCIKCNPNCGGCNSNGCIYCSFDYALVNNSKNSQSYCLACPDNC